MACLPRQQNLRHKLVWLGVVAVVLVGLAVAWSWSPMRAWLDVDAMVGALQRFSQSFGPAAAVAGFALALTFAVPLVFLTLVALAAYGPWMGFACTVSGALLGATASYGIGAFLGREVLRRLAGERINLISERLAQHGLLAVIVVRLVPVAPFAVVNMVAGSSHIRLHHLLLGTAIGMTPGTLAMMLFVDQITEALRQPSALTFALLALTVVLIVAGGWAMQHWLRRLGRRGK
ncbi:MAG: VTT domain-containing protein [Rhodoferax sp.]|nr:VTT domain-containing protein [Rhodoferax sp.]